MVNHASSFNLVKCESEGALTPSPAVRDPFTTPAPGECWPPSAGVDPGYTDEYRGWYDVQGCGKCNDYCRWVGGSESGGDPIYQVTMLKSWWSCAIGSSTKTAKNYFTSFNFVRCESEGAPTPSPAMREVPNTLPETPVTNPATTAAPTTPNPATTAAPTTPCLGECCPGKTYVPGCPGAPWSEQEVLAVKAKLKRVLFIGGGAATMRELHPEHRHSWRQLPSASKILRLGFHDCLRYTDGSGGCDGCLNWKGVGKRLRMEDMKRWKLPAVHGTDNNGMAATVEVLEGIYTDERFPMRTPVLEKSLYELGKSRADLWALATLVAVEHSIYMNNLGCDSPDDPWMKGLNQCVRDLPVCKVTMCRDSPGLNQCVRSFKFTTGRKDCIPDPQKKQPYMASKDEHHPNPVTNGEGTLKFMKEVFGFNGRETIAMMGSHTIGRMHVAHTNFRYTWTFRNEHLFNHQYFRNIVGKRDFMMKVGGDCQGVGDAYGKPGLARWLPHTQRDGVDGGPVQWIQEKLVCPVCNNGVSEGWSPSTCCNRTQLIPKGGHCVPDNNRGPSSVLPGADDNVNGGCEMYKFIVGVDESALSSEIGLYLDFKEINGAPAGCKGLEKFNSTWWKTKTPNGIDIGYWYTWSQINNVKMEPLCPPNKLAEPPGSQPLHEIFEEFADNQQSFVNEFVPALEKMLSNGYGAGDLTQGPNFEDDIVCPPPEGGWNFFVTCYSTRGMSEPYMIVSKLNATHPKVLQVNQNSRAAEMWDKTGTANQIWRWTADGTQLINSFTQAPLAVAGHGNWYLNGDFIHLLHGKNNEVIDRGLHQGNGAGLTVWKKHGNPWQQFKFEPLR